jgi:hypothetical protein
MKKFIFFVLLIITVFMACSKQNKYEEKAKQKKELSPLVKEIFSIRSNSSIMPRAFATLLSSTQRGEVWEIKLRAILTNDSSLLTTAQRNIVLELLGMITTYGMDSLINNPEIGENFLDSTKLAYYSTQFTAEQVLFLTEHPYYEENFSIFNSDDYVERIAPWLAGLGGDVTNCTCRYNISCGLIGGYCDWEVTCVKVYTCGLFGTSSCKGICD